LIIEKQGFKLKIFESAEEFKNYTKNLNGKVGFVPTMGALHDGHISLVKKAKEENDFCVVSIFINPTQFLVGEDLSKYPRRIEADTKLCELAGVDALFLPTPEQIYKEDEPTIKSPPICGYVLEGLVRPGHFDGVLTVVMKLLNVSSATKAYFGQKDAQQLILIEQMVKRYFMSVEIVPCPTVREKDGLAMSSRNAYLDDAQKKASLAISKSLFAAGIAISAGEFECVKLESKMREELAGLDVEYVAFCDRNLQKQEKIELKNSLILVAAKVGSTRLIDNIWI
jgi:pantoate--beta-alanine ligase